MKILVFALTLLLPFGTSLAQGLANTACIATVKVEYSGTGGEFPRIAGKIVLPGYPAEQQRLGISAEVTFEATVEENGSIGNVGIKKVEAPSEESRTAFETSVQEAIKAWTFRPSDQQPKRLRYPFTITGRVLFLPGD